MRHKSFRVEKKKTKILWEDSVAQENQVDNLPKDSIVFTSEHYNKKVSIFPLLVDSPIIWNGSFIIENLPEWMIPMLHPIGYFSVPGDGFDASTIDFSGGADVSFDWWLNKIGENTYVFQFNLDTDGSFDAALLANVYLYIINDRVFEQIVKGKE